LSTTPRNPLRLRAPTGFTLLELAIVVVILGVIAAIAVLRLATAASGTRASAFVATLNRFAYAVEAHHAETGEWISDSDTGLPPVELVDRVDTRAWSSPTPLGGSWDIDDEYSGVIGLGVHGPDDADGLRRADEIIDNGDVHSGVFRFVAPGRCYLVLKTN
jgi:prepilin-type N-terminal cleavage/methylation domain-containing protein